MAEIKCFYVQGRGGATDPPERQICSLVFFFKLESALSDAEGADGSLGKLNIRCRHLLLGLLTDLKARLQSRSQEQASRTRLAGWGSFYAKMMTGNKVC